jgi:hypothetical protein
LENLEEIDHLERASMDEEMILKCILEKQDVRLWTGFSWLGIEHSGGIKGKTSLSSDCYMVT